MSKNTLSSWIEDFQLLQNNLEQKLQQLASSSSNIQQIETFPKDGSTWMNSLKSNQMAYSNKDLFILQFINNHFTLSQFSFNSRYEQNEYQVKLINSISDSEIQQNVYSNSIFEFSIQETNITLIIKSTYNKNQCRQSQHQLDNLFKEIFIGMLKSNNLVLLYSIKNVGLCQQIAFHPLNPNYILLLQASNQFDKKLSKTSDQYFCVYQIQNPKQSLFKYNLNLAMQGKALSFSCSQKEDENEFLIYFINSQGVIYYYSLILPDMIININTKLYFLKNHSEIVKFMQQKSDQEIKVIYDCSSSDEYIKGQIKFQNFKNVDFTLPQSSNVLISKMSLKNFYLFIIICKLSNGNLSVISLLGKDLITLYEISNHEVEYKIETENISLNRTLININQPKIVYDKNHAIHIVQDKFDLANRNQLIVQYLNQLIIVDYSNMLNHKQNQSPISISCIDFSETSKQIDSKKIVGIQQTFLQQIICVDLFFSKILLFRGFTNNQQIWYKLVNQKQLLNLSNQDQDIIDKQILNEYEQFKYQQNVLQELKCKLIQLNKKVSICQTEDEILQINTQLINIVREKIKGVAIKIQFLTENLYSQIKLGLNETIKLLVQNNMKLNDKIRVKNEKINFLLEQIQQIPSNLIKQQLINQQKKEELLSYDQQFQQIQGQINNIKSKLEDQINQSNRSAQEIDVIQNNLIQQILEKIKLL